MAIMRGALVEYTNKLLGPLPNVVLFQFNPDSMTRTIKPPKRPTTTKSAGQKVASGLPSETISLSLVFSAHADSTGLGMPWRAASTAARAAFGVGPQLAALEKMLEPSRARIPSSQGAVPKAVKKLGKQADTKKNIPRYYYPNILFIWGASRVLPVLIESMTINETLYDGLLNPIEAKVTLGLVVLQLEDGETKADKIALGALKYTQKIKQAQAVANTTQFADVVADIIPL